MNKLRVRRIRADKEVHMQEYIQKRVLEICGYILDTRATVRQAA